MYEKVDCRHQSDAVDPAGCGASPAAFITIPRLVLPVDLHSQGDPSRLIPILHGIGHYVDLEPLMKNDCSPLSVLKKALRQWFTEMLSEAVDRLTDFEVDFFTESQLQNHPPFEFDTEPGDYVLLFQLGSPDVEDFSVGKTIVRYEKEFPGLGQKILRKINDATPFDIGTPEHFLDVVRDNCWNGYSSDQEYLEEICAFEEEEERWRCTATKYGLRGMTSGTISNHGCLPPTRLHIRALCPRSCKRYSICRRGNTATSHILPIRLCCPASSSGTAK